MTCNIYKARIFFSLGFHIKGVKRIKISNNYKNSQRVLLIKGSYKLLILSNEYDFLIFSLKTVPTFKLYPLQENYVCNLLITHFFIIKFSCPYIKTVYV